MNSEPNKSKGLVIGGIVAGVLVLGFVGFFGWAAIAPSAPRLPVESYLANARGLSGNRYEVQVRIERQLGARAGAGRILLARDPASGRSVTFLDGGKVLNFNPEPGQLYTLTVLVAMDGLLELLDARKR